VSAAKGRDERGNFRYRPSRAGPCSFSLLSAASLCLTAGVSGKHVTKSTIAPYLVTCEGLALGRKRGFWEEIGMLDSTKSL